MVTQGAVKSSHVKVRECLRETVSPPEVEREWCVADTEQHEKAGEKSSEKRTLISRDHYETTEKVWAPAQRAAMDVNRYNVRLQ